MIRKAFKMKVFSDNIEQHVNRHNSIWQELEEVLKKHGVGNYSIFLDPDSNSLFGYAEIECEEKWNTIADTAVCKKWWTYMADLMKTNEDNSPVSKDLKPLFYMP